MKAVKPVSIQGAMKKRLARVPGRFVHGVLRNDVKQLQGSLFAKDGVNIRKLSAWCAGYENRFSGQGIELLIAGFDRMDEQGRALFRSKGEWVSVASGNSAENAREYYRAIESLCELHQFIDKEHERPDFIHSTIRPVSIGSRNDSFMVQIHPDIRERPAWRYLIPLGLCRELREGGIKRVQATQVKLYLYILTRINSGRSHYECMDLRDAYAAAGLSPMAKRNRSRARARAAELLNALVALRWLESWEMKGGDHISLAPNKFHFSNTKEQKHKRAFTAPGQASNQ